MFASISLTVVEGPHRGEAVAWVDRTEITIGRSDECAFRLRGAYEDLLVSRRHCLIKVHPDWIEIRDLESRNGTYVNGQRIGFPISGRQGDGSTAFKRRLKDGDEIRIGNSVLQLTVRETPAHALPAEEAEFFPAYADGL